MTDSAATASLRSLSRHWAAWDEQNKQLTRILVRISNAVLELSHIDDEHMWRGAASGCDIEARREAATDAIAGLHAHARTQFGRLAGIYLSISSALSAVRTAAESRLADAVSECGTCVCLMSSEAQVAGHLNSSAARDVDAVCCAACARRNDSVHGAARYLECVDRLSSGLLSMYGRELAVKEAVVRHLLPQSGVAAARRLAAAAAAAGTACPARPGPVAETSAPSSGAASAESSCSPAGSGIVTPIPSVVGLGGRHPGLTPAQESDRDRLTALTAAVSMEVCIDPAERDELYDALVLAVRSGGVVSMPALRGTA